MTNEDFVDCKKESEMEAVSDRIKLQQSLDHLECSDSGVASLASSDSSSWGSDITEPTSPRSLASVDSPLESASHEDHSPIPSPSQEEQKASWAYLNLGSDANPLDLLSGDICWRRNSVTCDGEEEKMVTGLRKRHSSNPSCAKDLAESSLLADCDIEQSMMPEECNCHFVKREHLEWPIYPSLTVKQLNGYSIPWSSEVCQCRLKKSRRFKQLRITDYFKLQSKSSQKWIGLCRQTQGTKEDGKRSPRVKSDITTSDDLSWLLRNSSGTNISLSSKCLQGADVPRIPSPPPSRDLTLPDLISSLTSEAGVPSDSSLATELDLVNIEVEIRDNFVVQREQIKPVSRTIDSPPVQKRTGILCLWEKCEAAVPSKDALLDHIKLCHVYAQSSGSSAGEGNFTCQWAGCKVQGRSSKCQNWLERHVLCHVDSKPSSLKPFSCIVDGCGQRFGSQLMLQRHVNSHFSTQSSSNGSSLSKKNGELTPTKLARKNNKKLRCRKRKAVGSQIDFFDTGMTHKLHTKVIEEAEKCKLVTIEDRSFQVIGDCLRLTSEVICRRKVRKSSDEVLVSWHPEDICPQEWVSCQSVPKEKLLHLSRIPAIIRQQVLSAVKPQISSAKCSRKRARLAETQLT